jgi:hemerythrin-like metal-binding protein
MPRDRLLIGKQCRLGNDVIDSDHMAIADCWLRAVNCDQLRFEFFIARLKKLMREHFDHEVILMDRAGVRLCECHRREHQMLLDLCDRAAALSRHNWRKAQTLLRRKLAKLFREHIICMDQLTVLFINTHGEIARMG